MGEPLLASPGESQWKIFQQRGLSVKVDNEIRFFRPENVLGDGNCLFRSLVQSPMFPMTDHLILRRELTEWMEAEVMSNSNNGKMLREDYLKHSYSDCRSFEKHIENMKKSTVWGTDTEIVAFTLHFGIRVVTVVNALIYQEFAILDSMEAIHAAGLGEGYGGCNQTIYIYYHQLGNCLIPKRMQQLNHFCLLHELASALPNPFVGYPRPINNNEVIDICKDTDTTRKEEKTKRQMDLKDTFKKSLKSTKKRKKEMSKEERKQVKQDTLARWLGSMKTNEEQVSKREAQLLTIHELEVSLGCSEVLEKIIKKIEMKEGCDCNDSRKTIFSMYSGRKELTWETRSLIIYYHLHQLLGNRDIEKATSLFGVCLNTLKAWLTKTHYKQRWISLVRNLKFEDVLRVIPLSKDAKSKMKRLTDKLPSDLKKLNMSKISGTHMEIKSKNSCKFSSHQAIKAKCVSSKIFCPYVRNSDKRIRSKEYPKTTKHCEANQFVGDIILKQLNMGIPIGKLEIATMLVTEAKKRKSGMKDFLEIYGKGDETAMKKLHIFVERAMTKVGFCQREKTISQKIPADWRTKSESGAARIRATFTQEKVDVILAADETFIRFHEDQKKVNAKEE